MPTPKVRKQQAHPRTDLYGPGAPAGPMDDFARVAEVEGLVTRGAWTLTAAREVAARYQVDVAVVRADRRKVLRKASERLTDRAQAQAQLCLELEASMREAREVGDFKAVATLARTRAELLGLMQPQKVEVTGSVGHLHVAALTDADLNARLADLRRRTAVPVPVAPALPVPAGPTDP